MTDRNLFHTSDGGATWQVAPVPVQPPYPVPGGRLFVDGSTAWVAVLSPTLTVIKVAAPAMTVTTTSVTGTGTQIDSASLDFLDTSRGWMTVASRSSSSDPNLSAHLYQTTDGGASWQLVPSASPPFGPVHFISPTSGWALQDKLLRTADGGRTWREQAVPIKFSSATPGGYEALSLFGQEGVLEAGYPTGNFGYPVYAVTDDGGNTWQVRGSQFSAPDPGLVYNGTGPPLSFSAADGRHWRASVYDHVLATDDAGLHWTQVAASLPFHIIQGLSFSTPTMGWAYALEPDFCQPSECTSHLEATTDGGHDWHEMTLPLPAR